MAVNETIVTGRKFRKLVDSANKSWQRISFWHKASDCEFDDGKTAQTKVGAISGITSDLSGESENVAASIKCVNSLNNSLGGFTPVIDETGKITGYKTKVGADTVFPFSSIKTQTITQSVSMQAVETRSYTFIFDELEEVKGVLQITKKSTSKYGTSQYLIPVNTASQNENGSFWSINGNTVTITMRNQVNQSSSADWTIIAVGF